VEQEGREKQVIWEILNVVEEAKVFTEGNSLNFWIWDELGADETK